MCNAQLDFWHLHRIYCGVDGLHTYAMMQMQKGYSVHMSKPPRAKASHPPESQTRRPKSNRQRGQFVALKAEP